MRSRLCLVFLFFFFAGLCSCTRRPLDIEADMVRIALDNDYHMPYKSLQQHPYHYGVMMYFSEGGVLSYNDFCSEQGGFIRGDVGSYQVFVYSLDNDVTKFDGEINAGTFRAYTDEADVKVKSVFKSCRDAFVKKATDNGIRLSSVKGSAGFEGDLVIREPNEVFSGLNCNVVIPNLALSDGEYVIPVSTDYAFSQCRLTFHGVSHTERIASVQVFITNLAKSKYIVSESVEQEPAAISFYCDIINEEYIQGCFNYFGKLSVSGMVNTAYVVITDTAGGRYLFVVDVTNQFECRDDNADLVIRLDFDVPNPDTGGAGFDPNVDDWSVVWKGVHIG